MVRVSLNYGLGNQASLSYSRAVLRG